MNDGPDQPEGRAWAQRAAVAVLALGFVLLGLYTLRGFLDALAWAAIFAVALWPLYTRTATRLRARRGGALLPAGFTLAVALVFIAPLGLAAGQLASETHAATEWLRDAREHGVAEPDVLRKLPFGQAQVDRWWQENLADPDAAKALVERTTQGRVMDVGREVGVQVVRRLTVFAFTLLALFFLFKEGETVVAQMRRAALRTFGPGGERVGRQIIASVHGTVDGLVLVGLGEGLLLGIVYALAGVPHPTVFGAMTAVAAMIPFAAPVVFLVAAALLLAQGSLAWALAVAGAGFAVTFTADHFIRPVLIGGATQLPFLWVLLGILGGVEGFGLLGLFLGPAIMAVLILLWREWAGGPQA